MHSKNPMILRLNLKQFEMDEWEFSTWIIIKQFEIMELKGSVKYLFHICY